MPPERQVQEGPFKPAASTFPTIPDRVTPSTDTHTEDPVVAGPAVDAAAVVADLHPLPGEVHGRHQVQVDRPCDTGQDDVADLQLRRVDRGNDHLLPTTYQRDHRGAAGPERHGGPTGNPARHCIQSTHPMIVADSPASPHRFTSRREVALAGRSPRLRPARAAGPAVGPAVVPGGLRAGRGRRRRGSRHSARGPTGTRPRPARVRRRCHRGLRSCLHE